MGVVYRARSPEGEVALKVLLKPDAREALARFERERRLLASLAEEGGFVPLLDAGDSPHGPFYVMPLLQGGTLRARLVDGARLPVEETVALGVELSRALARAHEKGIVHRDLKPENVLFTQSGAETGAWGRALVADLGLAKHFRRDVSGGSQSLSLTGADDAKGTLGYMAPEQLRSVRDATPASDVFALGAILYECLAGARAFEGATSVEVQARVVLGTFDPLRGVRPETPRWLERVVARALQVDPAKRFRDAGELSRALEARGGGGPGARRLLGATAVALAGLLVALTWALGGGPWHPAPTPETPPPLSPPTPPAPPPVPAPPLRPRVVGDHALADDVPESRLSVDPGAARVVLGGPMGRGTTVVLDEDGREVGRLPVVGGLVDARAHRIYASTGYGGDTVAFDATTLEPIWRTKVGFCGGVFDLDPGTDLLYEVLQCGGQSDPLVVLEAATGSPAAEPIRSPRVATAVVVDPRSGRAYVSTGGHVVDVHAPRPGFALERQLADMDALAVDASNGRLYARRTDGRLVFVEPGGDPVVTEQEGGPLAVDAAAGRLYLGAKDAIRVLGLDATKEVTRVELAGATPLQLALDGKGRLYALVARERARALVVLDLGPSPRAK
jgi:hypothetical protein